MDEGPRRSGHLALQQLEVVVEATRMQANTSCMYAGYAPRCIWDGLEWEEAS